MKWLHWNSLSLKKCLFLCQLWLCLKIVYVLQASLIGLPIYLHVLLCDAFSFGLDFASVDNLSRSPLVHPFLLGIPIFRFFRQWFKFSRSLLGDSNLDILSLVFQSWYSLFWFPIFIFSVWDSNLNVVSLGFQSSYSPSVIASVFHLGAICAWLHTVNVCVYIYVQLTVVLCCLHVCHALRCLHVCDVERWKLFKCSTLFNGSTKVESLNHNILTANQFVELSK